MNKVVIENPVEGRLWRVYFEESYADHDYFESLTAVVAMWGDATMSDHTAFELYELHPDGDVWLAEHIKGHGYGRAYSIDVPDGGEKNPLPGRYRNMRAATSSK